MTTQEQESKTGSQRARTGLVQTISGDKTVSVMVNKLVKHPRYGKYVRRRTKLAVHDPTGAAGIGDVVEIIACRRISKNKSWRLLRVIRRGRGSRVSRSK